MESWAERRNDIVTTLSQLASPQSTPASSDQLLHQTILRSQDLQAARKELPPNLGRIASNSLSIDDFRSISTLSTSGPFNRVELVIPESSLTGRPVKPGKCFVVKTVDRRWAFRMRQQQSIAHEIAVLRLSSASSDSDSESARIPLLVASFLTSTSIHLVLSHASGGDLWTLLESSLVGKEDLNEALSEEWVRYWLAEVLDCVEWLHSKGWAHRDIKPHNLLLLSSGHLQLTDFGSASPLSSDLHSISKKYALALVGTPDYIAPEILRYAEQIAEESNDFESSCWRESEQERAYGKEVDLWSCGVVVYELLFGKAPFFAEEISETYERIINFRKYLAIPQNTSVSEEARDLISKLLVEPDERPSISTLKQHPWFRNMDWSKLRSTPPPYAPPHFVPPSVSPSTSPSHPNPQSNASFTTFSQSFFSSPGLSILRPSPSTLEGARKEERKYWEASEMGGLTTLPPADTFRFSLSASDEPLAQVRPLTSPPLNKLVRDFSRLSYETPARSVRNRFEGVNGSAPPSSGRSRRLISDVEAWKEMQEHAWEVGVSAKKTRSSNVKKKSEENLMSGMKAKDGGPDSGRGNELGKLEERHGDMVRDLEEMGKKYGKLFELAAKEEKKTVS
ncbi:hypothetical protein JCM5353_003106 [Sporobolomyces roseus]